jgi:hypothetical protein
MFHVTRYPRNENKNYNEMPFHTTMLTKEKTVFTTTSVSKEVKKFRFSYITGGIVKWYNYLRKDFCCQAC